MSIKIKTVLYVVAINVAISLGAVIIFLYFHINEKIETPETLYVPRGSISQIISHINEEFGNEILIPDVDRFLISYFGNPQAGWLQLNDNEMTRGKFLETLTKAKGVSKGITLYPGETTEYFFYTMANKYNLDYEEVLDYFYTVSPMQEGFLIPNSYQFNSNIDIKKFIFDIVKQSSDKHTERLAKFGITDFEDLHKILTVASIIEKESGGVEEMPLVASVIYNRLDKNMRLQMDGTLNYGLYSHKKISANRIKNDNSRYNTYKYNGLPPEPICNPSFNAIKSALSPAETQYLFFFKKKGAKNHIFAKSYEEHLANIEGINLNKKIIESDNLIELDLNYTLIYSDLKSLINIYKENSSICKDKLLF
jgi:UPF0755 protein